ncbi:MAG: hydrogenase maturation nickel metallochaperone HypA [Anaerolineales bacterium]|nr:hydrogenase maturation nickel metallochaperone HypA [Anaerolineales bacterium]
MHELAITESILNISLRHAEKADAAVITDLFLVIGDLSSIVDDSVQFYWDIVSRGTIAEGALLHFKRIPVTMSCTDCGTEYEPDTETMSCPNCGGRQPLIITGEEFFLESITVEGSEEQQNSAAEVD